MKTSEIVAKEFGTSKNKVERAGKFAERLEREPGIKARVIPYPNAPSDTPKFA